MRVLFEIAVNISNRREPFGLKNYIMKMGVREKKKCRVIDRKLIWYNFDLKFREQNGRIMFHILCKPSIFLSLGEYSACVPWYSISDICLKLIFQFGCNYIVGGWVFGSEQTQHTDRDKRKCRETRGENAM